MKSASFRFLRHAMWLLLAALVAAYLLFHSHEVRGMF
jgi:hypothetical protein